MADYQRSSKTWVKIHVIFPLVPFLLEGIIRLGIRGFKVNLDTFSAPTLAMTVALLCIFVRESLNTTTRPLSDAEVKREINGVAVDFLIYTICGIAFFAVLVTLSELENLKIQQIKTAVIVFKIATLILAVAAVWYAIKVQKSFKLRAKS